MNKIIRFPLNRVKGAKHLRAQNKAEGKRTFLALSIVSLLAGIVMVNHESDVQNRPIYVMNIRSPERGLESRSIASVDLNRVERVSNYRDVMWEHQIAEKISQLKNLRSPSAVGESASQLDQLRFGVLSGKYRFQQVVSNESRGLAVSEIEYIDSLDSHDHPKLVSPSELLSEYRNIFAITYVQSRVKSSEEGAQIFDLLNGDGKTVGQAAFKLDDRRRLLSLKFQKNLQVDGRSASTD